MASVGAAGYGWGEHGKLNWTLLPWLLLIRFNLSFMTSVQKQILIGGHLFPGTPDVDPTDLYYNS